MLAILNSLNAHNFPIFEPVLIIFVSKLMIHRVLSDKTYLSLVKSLNAHNFPIFEPTLIIFVSKFMIHRVLSDKTYLSLVSLKQELKKILNMSPVNHY